MMYDEMEASHSVGFIFDNDEMFKSYDYFEAPVPIMKVGMGKCLTR